MIYQTDGWDLFQDWLTRYPDAAVHYDRQLADLVTRQRDGSFSFYSFSPGPLLGVVWMSRPVSRHHAGVYPPVVKFAASLHNKLWERVRHAWYEDGCEWVEGP